MPDQRLPAYGVAPAAEPEPFDYGVISYFGTDIRVIVDPFLLEITLEEFLELAGSLEETDVKAIGAVRAFLRSLIHPTDFATFWKAVKANRQDITAQMAFGRAVVEEMTGHPTAQPSDSSPGRQQTDPSSEDALSLRVQHRLESAGRPDLAVAVLARREHEQRTG